MKTANKDCIFLKPQVIKSRLTLPTFTDTTRQSWNFKIIPAVANPICSDCHHPFNWHHGPKGQCNTFIVNSNKETTRCQCIKYVIDLIPTSSPCIHCSHPYVWHTHLLEPNQCYGSVNTSNGEIKCACDEYVAS